MTRLTEHRLRRITLTLVASLLAMCASATTAWCDQWIDLGDENATLWLSVSLQLPTDRPPAQLTLATAAGEPRVRIEIGEHGAANVWLYNHNQRGQLRQQGPVITLVARITSHSKQPDSIALIALPAAAALPKQQPVAWDLVNSGGDSNANLSQAIVTPQQAQRRFTQLRVASSWNELQTAAIIDDQLLSGPPSPDLSRPDPVSHPTGGLMLDLPGTGTDMLGIDYDQLPALPCRQSIVSMGAAPWRFRLHNYLAWHDDRFWCIWSHGTDIEELPGQHVRYSTSPDGRSWSEPAMLVGPPSDPQYGYIARGLWQRDGELIALASRFKAPGFAGDGLSLHAFRWNKQAAVWQHAGMVLDDAMNNFAPKRLPDGNWMMTRRSGSRDVSVMIGGTKALDQWDVLPLASYTPSNRARPEEPYWYVLPDGRNIVGLFRNNSGRDLLRAFSTDNGRTWSPLVHTNFPDARSKFNVLRTSRDYYVMVSNANPQRRNPLCLSLSRDGLVFTRLGRLRISDEVEPPDWDLSSQYGNDGPVPSYQYPHVIEHEEVLHIAFSRRKQSIEVLQVSLDDMEAVLK